MGVEPQADAGVAMWAGRRGALLTMLLATIVSCLLWLTWVGAPEQLLNPARKVYEISRGYPHSKQVSRALWRVSATVLVIAFASAGAFMTCIVAFAFGPKSLAGGRPYGRIAGVIGLGGLGASILGSMLRSC